MRLRDLFLHWQVKINLCKVFFNRKFKKFLLSKPFSKMKAKLKEKPANKIKKEKKRS